MHHKEEQTQWGIPILVPLAYRYKRKVFFTRKLIDVLRKLYAISPKSHRDATLKAQLNRKLFDHPEGTING